IYTRLEDNATGCFTIATFTIEVIPAPAITSPITDYILCDNDQDGTEDFDLTSKEPEILNTINPATVTVSYYLSVADRNNGIAIATPNAFNSAGQTIYFRVTSNDPTACFSDGQFELDLYDQVAFNTPADLIICDDGVSDGFATFNLSTATTQITGNNANLDVSYYLTQPLADNGDSNDELPNSFTNTIPDNQTIWVRIVNLTTGCYALAPLNLQVNEAPTAIQPAPFTYCDEENDGFGSFILSDLDSEITGGVAGVIVTYHRTLPDANNDANPITANPFFNTVPFTQIIYARVESPGVACFSVVPVTLQVLDSPQTEEPDDLIACDVNQNGTAVFDLTDVETQLMVNIPNPSAYTISYYANQADITNNNPISVPTAYNSTSSLQTIYVIVEDGSNNCQSQEEFNLIVAPLPQIFPPTPLELCDEVTPNDEREEFNLGLATQEITGGDSSITVSYHLTQNDADLDLSPLPTLYTNVVNNQTIYIRVESSDGCIITQGFTLTLIVNPLPSPAVPLPLEVCDPSNDGFSTFNLEDATPQILNGEPNVVATYHETFTDANLGNFPLTSPYANIVQYQQTIYVRVENSITGCYIVVELDLIVNDTPIVPLTLPDIVVCSEDQIETGIIFDLTENEDIIYGTQDENDFDLTYHLTEQNAIDDVSPIADPENYPNTTNPQTIWVRLEDGNTECSTIRSFEIRVELPPVIGGPFTLSECDDDTDGFFEFDLTVMNSQFTLSAPGLDVQYYESQTEAEDGINQIDPDNEYTNISNPQTLFVKVVDGDSGCASYSTLTIRVNPNPDIETPEPIVFCDTEGIGFQEFDLTVRNAEILNGEVGTISYHLNLEDAEDNTNPILNFTTYTNVETPQQIIYVRVTNDTTGCYSIVELILIVNPLPEISEISDYTICEVNTDGFATFDLTTKITEILNGQNPMDFEVSFYESQSDADNGLNAIQNPDSFINNIINEQEIFVRIENIDTECFTSNGSFFVRVLEGAEIDIPTEPLEVCEDELGSGIGTFDLTQLNNDILDGQDPLIFNITYHETLADAETGDNPIANPGAYQSPTQTIFVRVTNTDTECYASAEIQLVVITLSNLGIEDSYRLCLDEFGNPIPEESGSMSPPVIDTGLSDAEYMFIWELDGEILEDETSSSIIATQGGVYTVTIINIENGCESVATTTVIVSSPPLEYDARVTSLAFSDMHTIEATASGLGTYVFQLDDGPFQESGTFTNVTPGDHTITISDVNGCGSVVIEVGAIDYPLYFTPNGDGYHDTWNIIGIASNPTAKIYIFDRYGKLLKQLSPTGNGWDGTYNSNPLPSSDYWFKVEYQEDGIGKEFKGHFTLKR
ncbi:T9SS type B sorting domain-containing protein, partial [Aequorivita echinoideorum]